MAVTCKTHPRRHQTHSHKRERSLGRLCWPLPSSRSRGIPCTPWLSQMPSRLNVCPTVPCGAAQQANAVVAVAEGWRGVRLRGRAVFQLAAKESAAEWEPCDEPNPRKISHFAADVSALARVSPPRQRARRVCSVPFNPARPQQAAASPLCGAAMADLCASLHND